MNLDERHGVLPVEFVPVDHLSDLVCRAREDVSAWDMYLNLHSDTIHSALLATQPPEIKNDPAVALKLLDLGDTSQRLDALYIVHEYWSIHPQFASSCLHLAFHDPVSEVRGLALCCLPRLYAFINDSRRQLQQLLKAVHTEDKSEIKSIFAKCKATSEVAFQNMDEWNRREWETFAGPVLSDMMLSTETTEAFLDHADEDLRYVAVSMLTWHWEPTINAATAALTMLKVPAATPKLKCAALQLLGKYYDKSCNKDVGTLIAQIVIDTSEDPIVRRTAYVQLFWLRGIPLAGMPGASVLNSFPIGVNWSFVQSFIADSDRGSGKSQIH